MKKFLEHIWNYVGSKTILLGLLTAAVLLCFYDPTRDVGISLWKHEFSQASLAGIDVGKRISNFYFMILVLFPVVCCCCVALYSLLFAKLGWNPSLKCIGCRIVEILEKRLPTQSSRQLAGLGVFASFSVVVSLFSAVCIPFLAQRSDIYSRMSSSVLPDFMTTALVMGMLVAYVQIRKNRGHDINVYGLFAFYAVATVALSLLIPAGFTVCAVVAGIALMAVPGKIICRDDVKDAAAVLMWHVAEFCVLMEVLFSLCEKGLLHANFRVLAVVSWVVLTAFGILLPRLGKIKVWLSEHRTTVACLGGLVSLSMLGHVGVVYGALWDYGDFAYIYEMGNKMVAVDTLQKGALPVLDYFSAHSLFDVWTQILHGFVHGNVAGMLINPYEGLTSVLCVVVLFFLLKKAFDPYFAFLFLAFFPLDTLGLKSYTLCLVAILLNLWLSKNERGGARGIPQLVVFWTLIAVNAFFIYDDGIALGLGAIFCMLVVYGCRRDWRSAIRFVLIGGAVGVVVLALCALYCHLNGIALLDRLTEWLALSAGSNAVWATKEFGDPSKFAYYYSYYLLPFVATFIFIFTTIDCLRNRKVSLFAALAIIFSLAELLCIPRGLVWHNLWMCNGTSGRLLNFSHFTWSFFALFLATRKKESGRGLAYVWLFVIAGCIWLSNGVVTFYLPNTSSALYNHSAAASVTAQETFREDYVQDRYAYDEQTKALIDGFKEVFDTLLKKDETFLDFANMTSLYAMTGRDRPFYVAQSPSLLTNEKSMEMYFREIANYKIPLAITGVTDVPYTQSIGGVPHHVRYYKVAEYIYAHYVPLTQVGDFAIWCEKDKFKEYSQKLKNKTDIKWNDEFFYVDLQKLPYIWANHDAKKTIQDGYPYVECDLSDSVYNIRNYLDGESGARIVIESPEASKAEIFLGRSDKPESEYSFKFDLEPGKNEYLIRLNMNQNFYLYGINTAKIVCDNCTVKEFGYPYRRPRYVY